MDLRDLLDSIDPEIACLQQARSLLAGGSTRGSTSSGLLVLRGLAASWMPARRAATVEPMQALQQSETRVSTLPSLRRFETCTGDLRSPIGSAQSYFWVADNGNNRTLMLVETDLTTGGPLHRPALVPRVN